jgi:hypothetical protein
LLAFFLNLLLAHGRCSHVRGQDAGQEVVGGSEEVHVVAPMVHFLNVIGKQFDRVGVGSALLQLGEGGFEQVHLTIDLLLLPFVEALALLASLGGESLADGGEEVGHAGEVAAGFPVLPADLAEGEAGGVVEGEEEEPAAVFFLEAAVGVEGPTLPFLPRLC